MAGIRIEVRGADAETNMYDRLKTMTIHFDGEEMQKRAAFLFSEMEKADETSAKAGAVFGIGLAKVLHEFVENESQNNAETADVNRPA